MTGPLIEIADPETGEIVSLPGLPALPGAGPLGLDLPPSLTWDQWSAYGATLQTAQRAMQWLIGDWLRYGEAKWPDRYTQAVRSTGLDVQTLRNALWVAGRIPPAVRREGLSWSHHAEVAGLEPDRRDELLDWSLDEVATRSELRAEIERRGLRQGRSSDTASDEAEGALSSRGENGADLSTALAAWLAEGRRIAAQVRRGVPFAVSWQEFCVDELTELLQVLDRAADDDARRAAA